MYHYKGAGLDNVYLQNGYHKAMYGDEEIISVSNIEGLHAAIAAELVEKPARLTGPELRFLRIELDLSQKVLSELLRVSDQTVASWEKGMTKGASGPSELLLRVFARERLLNRDGHVSQFIETLAHLDNAAHERLLFEASSNTWKAAA